MKIVLIPLRAYLREMDLSYTTGWRWRKKYPWFKCVNIAGKAYATADAITELERRALNGELALPLTGAAAAASKPSS